MFIFNETKFIDGYVDYFLHNTVTQLDMSFMYHKYVQIFVENNTVEYNKFLIEKYSRVKLKNIKEEHIIREAKSVFMEEKFITLAEEAIEDHYDSDADTEKSEEIIDIETEFYD
jgi:hypothetical protein